MCGIFGWLLPSGRQAGRDLLVSSTGRLAHRGPDDSGFWTGQTRNGSHQISFGHRRLSIIDIGGGVQPMTSPEGRIALVFNGEIYNYVELRDELMRAGHTFRTASDTEVLIEAYKAWGPGALPRLRGMFAFALWDAADQTLMLARDAFGKKPLFYSQCEGGIVFGSEIEPLIRFPKVDNSLEPGAVGHYLLNRFVPGPHTFFRGVKKLPPGCVGLWQADKPFRVERYFTPPIATSRPDVGEFGEAVALFGDVFEEAVRLRMRSDAPFGAYLSGGIDSSAVVSTMMKYSGMPVRTFAVGFDEEEYSELRFASQVARRIGTDHNEVVVNSENFREAWSEAILRRGAPVSQTSDIPILLLSKLASKTVKMVLTGEGGDELLGGYPKHRAESLVGLYQSIMPQAVHEYLVAPVVRSLPYSMRRAKIFLTAAGERDFTNRMRYWFAGMSTRDRDLVLGQSLSSEPPDRFPFSMGAGSNGRKTMFFDQTSWLPDNLLERGDRMMMAGSIEGRMPFMDTELAKVVARLPDKFLLGGKGGKLVLREAMKGILPKDIIYRKKAGFRVPVSDWMQGPYQSFIRDHLTGASALTAHLFDRKVVGRLVDEHMSARQDHEKILWSLMNLELFLRMFKPGGC
jgi:asparagine synthase (glutamine-hydrolysing)